MWARRSGNRFSKVEGIGGRAVDGSHLTQVKFLTMNQMETQLRRVSEKLQQLLTQYQALQKDNERCRQELLLARQTNEQLAAESQKWRQQAEVLKLSKSDMPEAEKKAFEKRLNQYVKEIDRCISMLGE